MIAVNQLNQSQLAAFILANTSGGNFSGILNGYLAGDGYLGENVVYSSGGAQEIDGSKTFVINPTVPYSGATGTAPSTQWVVDYTRTLVYALSGTTTGAYITTNTDQLSIGGVKGFTGAVTLSTPGFNASHAATLGQVSGASGILAAQISAGSVSLATLQATSGSLLTSLADTGAALIARDLAISGALQVLINAGGGGGGANGTGIFVQLTGNQIVSGVKTFTGMVEVGTPTTLGGAVNVSGLSGASGSLITSIATTGQAAWLSANGAAGNLSGDLTQSGVTLYQLSTGMSGVLTTRDIDISGALQAQIAGANGTQVSVTGGGTMGFAAFTGQGGLNVYTIGSTVYVSGGAGGGGGDVTQAQLDSLSGYSNATFATITNLAGTGTALYATMTGLSGQGVTDYATKLQLTNTGVALGATILSASGALQAQIAAGGSQVRVSGSSTIAIADISGAGTTSVTYNGTQVIVSGAAGAAGGGTTTLARWTALDNSPTATAYATFDTANNIPVLNFDAVTGESGIFSNIMPQGASFSNGIDARIFFRSAGGTTGAVVWNLAFESGNSNISTDGWTTGLNSSGAPANGTLGMQTVATISFSSTEIGGLTAGDFFRTRLSRVSLNAADTMTGDAQFTAMEIRQR